MQIAVNVNGTDYTRVVEPRLLLIHFIRDELGLTGSHWGCDTSNCGACVLWLDDVAGQVLHRARGHGRRPQGPDRRGPGSAAGTSTRCSRASPSCHGLQCGFCTPGMMLTARWLLDHNPDPTEDEIREAISGQICRCTGYENIVRSVRWAARRESGADR